MVMPLSALSREPKFKLETRRVVKHFDTRTMKARDGRDQAESQAVSRCVATVFESIEALKNLFTLIRGNAGSVVGDRNDRATVHGFAGNDDLSSVVAVLDCIVHEIGDGIKNQIAIADRQHFAVSGHGEKAAALLGRSVVQLDDLMGDFDEVHGSKPFLPYLGLDLRYPRY